MTTKFCKDCAHHLGRIAHTESLCQRPRANDRISPVTGEVERPGMASCEAERAPHATRLNLIFGPFTQEMLRRDQDRCGPDAQHFVQRQEPQPPNEGTSRSPCPPDWKVRIW